MTSELPLTEEPTPPLAKLVWVTPDGDNLLAYMVSFTAAKASGKWLITSSDERAARKLTIDPKEAERLFEQRVRQRDRLKEDFAGHPLLEVTYEALC